MYPCKSSAGLVALVSRGGELGRLRLGIVWRGQKLFRHGARVVVGDTQIHGLVLFRDRAIAFTFGVVSVALLDVRPHLDPGRLERAGERGVEVVERRLPIAL